MHHTSLDGARKEREMKFIIAAVLVAAMYAAAVHAKPMDLEDYIRQNLAPQVKDALKQSDDYANIEQDDCDASEQGSDDAKKKEAMAKILLTGALLKELAHEDKGMKPPAEDKEDIAKITAQKAKAQILGTILSMLLG